MADVARLRCLEEEALLWPFIKPDWSLWIKEEISGLTLVVMIFEEILMDVFCREIGR